MFTGTDGRCFCFKQKTAYGMRISDWSSDVCSSDLVARPGAHRADRDLDAVAHRDDDERQRGAPAAQFGDEFGDVHARRALIDEHRAQRHAFLRAELGERGVGRSEEHTSELQSLMRISYAVFCLEKKKTK